MISLMLSSPSDGLGRLVGLSDTRAGFERDQSSVVIWSKNSGVTGRSEKVDTMLYGHFSSLKEVEMCRE